MFNLLLRGSFFKTFIFSIFLTSEGAREGFHPIWRIFFSHKWTPINYIHHFFSFFCNIKKNKKTSSTAFSKFWGHITSEENFFYVYIFLFLLNFVKWSLRGQKTNRHSSLHTQYSNKFIIIFIYNTVVFCFIFIFQISSPLSQKFREFLSVFFSGSMYNSVFYSFLRD